VHSNDNVTEGKDGHGGENEHARTIQIPAPDEKKRYIEANRKERGRLLDEMETYTGLHRKSLIRLFKTELLFVFGKIRYRS